MHCDDSGGTGIPLVLVHGFPLDRTIWSEQMTALAASARVIAPDLPGFGSSSPPAATAPSIDGYADGLRDLLDRLGIDRTVVGGVSMGGYVALAFARRHPERLRGLILVCTKSGADTPEGRVLRDKGADLVRREGTAAIAAQMLPKMLAPRAAPSPALAEIDRVMRRQPPDTVIAALAALRDRPDATPGLTAITVPTLVVCGIDDTIIPRSESALLASRIRGARLVSIPHAGHLAHLDAPETFDAAVREFLATV